MGMSVLSQSVAGQATATFRASIAFVNPGTYTVYPRAVDTYGISNEVAVTVTAPAAVNQVALPTLTPSGGSTPLWPITVTADAATPGAQINYAVSALGTPCPAPTPGVGTWSALAAGPVAITVYLPSSVRVIAQKSGWTDSNAASGSFQQRAARWRNGGGFGAP
jgi:hypothetical protein